MSRIHPYAASPCRTYRIATITLAISAVLLTGVAPTFAQETPRIGAAKDVRTSKADMLIGALMDIGLGRVSAEQLEKRIVAGDQDAKGTAALLQQMAARMQTAGVPSIKQAEILEQAAKRGLTDASPGGAADLLVERALLAGQRNAPDSTVSRNVGRVVPVVSNTGLAVDKTPGGRTDGTDPVTSAPPGGPKSPVTVPDVRADVVTGASGRTTKEDVASRLSDLPAEGIRSELGKALSESATERPAFDQGMAGRPKVSESDTAQFRGSAISRMTGGQVVGGPLGEAAAGTKNGPGGSGAAASSRVSDGSITAPATYSDDGVRGMGTAVRDAYKGGALQGVVNLISSNTDKTNQGGAMQQALCAENGCAPSGGTGKTSTTDINGVTVTTHPSGATSVSTDGGSLKPGGSTSYTSSKDPQGRPTQQTVVTNNGDGTRTVDIRVITYADENDSVGKTKSTFTGTNSCPQDLEGCGGKPSDSDIQRRLNDKNFQIVQQAKAGGEVTPDRNDSLGARNTNPVIAVDAQSQLGQRLLGQPGVGLNDRGGGSGPGFNDRNNGALDPGRDAVHTGGTGREQNRFDDAINGRVGTPSGVPARSEEDKEKDKEKEEDNKGKDGAASG